MATRKRLSPEESRLAALGLTVANLRNALASVSYDVPAGSLTANTQDIVVRATADVTTVEDFENLYINDRVQFRDIASVTLGPDPGASVLRANGATGIGMGIVRQAKSNTLEISNGVRQATEDLKRIMPDGVDIRVIQALLGHAKLNTTAFYTKVATKTMRAVVSPLDRLALAAPDNEVPSG